VAELQPDFSFFLAIENDDANTRCAMLQSYFPAELWSIPESTAEKARREWPADIFLRRPYGQDESMLHPALLAVKILCEERESRVQTETG
jgi:hypothetical protein